MLSSFLADVYEETTSVSRQFDVRECKVNVSMEAALNISGMSKLEIKSFDCNSGGCADRSRGICTKWRVGARIDLGAVRLSLKGYTDANMTYQGGCSLLKQLPAAPPFMTNLRIVKPRVMMDLRADVQLVPPKISNAVFSPTGFTGFTFVEVEDFEKGFRWSPVVEEICGDHLASILREAKREIPRLVGERLWKREPSLQSATTRAAEKSGARKQ